MKQMSFEKKERRFIVEFDEEKILIREETMNRFYPCNVFYLTEKDCWVFYAEHPEFIEEIIGKGHQTIYIAHPLAEEVYKEQVSMKEEQKRLNITSGEIKLNFVYDVEYFSFNGIFFNDEYYYDFYQYVTNETLKEHILSMLLPIESVEKRLVNYFMYDYSLIRNINDFEDLRSNPYVKDIVVELTSDLRGKWYYVSNIILKDFQALEDLVYMLFKKDIEKTKKEKEK
jgi:hypothetical protein